MSDIDSSLMLISYMYSCLPQWRTLRATRNLSVLRWLGRKYLWGRFVILSFINSETQSGAVV